MRIKLLFPAVAAAAVLLAGQAQAVTGAKDNFNRPDGPIGHAEAEGPGGDTLCEALAP